MIRLPQSFVVRMEPVAKGRPRTAMRGDRPMIYTPTGTRDAEQTIRDALREQGAQLYPRGVPVELRVTFGVTRPKDAPSREDHPPRRPDLPNYLMLVCDAGTGVLWDDDAQVVRVRCEKVNVTRPRVIVNVGVPMDESRVAPSFLMRWERWVLEQERKRSESWTA